MSRSWSYGYADYTWPYAIFQGGLSFQEQLRVGCRSGWPWPSQSTDTRAPTTLCIIAWVYTYNTHITYNYIVIYIYIVVYICIENHVHTHTHTHIYIYMYICYIYIYAHLTKLCIHLWKDMNEFAIIFCIDCIYACAHACKAAYPCKSLWSPAAIVSRIQSGSVGMNHEAQRMLGTWKAVPTKESWRKWCGGAILSSEGCGILESLLGLTSWYFSHNLGRKLKGTKANTPRMISRWWWFELLR